ncbi:MAG: hypothetical protein QNJ72_08045 [Pleurocapsa sp. MO_226.B13]|nr:hypothetical protein [Pleurocapsa sp. MO_226.B13]
MTSKTKIQKSQPDKILTSLNPNSEHFNFDIWAREVRQQMRTVLQQRLKSSQEKASQ